MIKLMKKEGVHQTSNKHFKLKFDSKNFNRFENLLEKRKAHNHFPCNFEITQKKMLYKNLKEHFENLGQDPFEIMPITFHIK